MFSKSLEFVDSQLNKVTQYRLMLYYLSVIWSVALLLIFLKIFPFSPLDFCVSTLTIFFICYITNKIFEKLFNAITNFESVFISALILSLIITPILNLHNVQFLIAASVLAMTSKFIFAFNKKHFFNPVAIGVLIPSFLSIGSASWWIGDPIVNVVIFLGGVLIIRKIQRVDLLLSYLISFTIVNSFSYLFKSIDIVSGLNFIFILSPTLFFSFIMLTEPSTTPPKQKFRVPYGILIGVFSFYFPLEVALIIGNIFSYFFSAKKKFILALGKKMKLSDNIYGFVFNKPENFNFKPGQYMEWTVKSNLPDSRGNRRYFTIASSPTESSVEIGIKVEQNASYFKSELLKMDKGDKIFAGNTAGDFVLPKENENLVFIAGGIGITPFRSMVQYLLDKNLKKKITLFYANKIQEEIIYKDVFDKAESKIGIKTVYTLTDEERISSDWKGYRGRVTEEIIKKEVDKFKTSIYYLSGPHAMVDGFENILKQMKIPSRQIKKDFFPGYV